LTIRVRFAYPVMLDVADRPIVIVGGGKVAARKAAGLLAAGAKNVRAVAVTFDTDFPAGIERISRAYRSDDLAEGELVFAATDDASVNESIVRDARARGILVCRADGEGDFTIPAVLRRGDVTIAVSTGAPALAVKIRDDIGAKFDPRWTAAADAMSRLRPWIIEKVADPNLRREILRDAIDRVGESESELKRALIEKYAELK
jgi:precorrin-2 dehydrogenase/sirohydrochlorin ferrochelatase